MVLLDKMQRGVVLLLRSKRLPLAVTLSLSRPTLSGRIITRLLRCVLSYATAKKLLLRRLLTLFS